MTPVSEALAALFALAQPPAVETVPLTQATGRVLAQDVFAKRTQPPFAASAMDGYAVRAADAQIGAQLAVIGTAQAGHGFGGDCSTGQAVRIFTGAPVPEGADTIIIQENVTRDGDTITITALSDGAFIRPAGDDFAQGDALPAPQMLRPDHVALLAAMNIAQVPVARRPDVAIIATGDELVPPGGQLGPDQIIASNSYGLHGLITLAGGAPRLLPIARDTETSLRQAFELAQGADLIVTIGGASVGDHDLVGPVAQDMGLDRQFYKLAMRPGKPLMAGRMGDAIMVGLPGNPVSAMVCGQVFLVPLIAAMQGLPARPAARISLPLTADIGANGPREHYMRATRSNGGVAVCNRQDSALLSVLARADCLVVRPPHDGPRKAGDMVDVLGLI